MRKDRFGLVRSSDSSSTSCSLNRSNSRLDRESDEENQISCLPSSAHSALASGELLCGKLRLFTEELKVKFSRKKTRSTSKNNSSFDAQLQKEEENRIVSNDCNNNPSRPNSGLGHDCFDSERETGRDSNIAPESRSPFVHRALPPLPSGSLDDELGGSSNRLQEATFSILDNDRRAHESSGDEEFSVSLNRRSRRRRQSPDETSQSSVFTASGSRFGFIPPPHLQRPQTVEAFDYDDEDDAGSVDHSAPEANHHADLVQSTATNLINLNANLIRESESVLNVLPSTCNAILDVNDEEMRKMLDYAASIEKVKDCGWYWGPISGDKAEKLLANEPDGSFIVRDSSDEHYIFSLTFKVNGTVRHVRIEHDQGKSIWISF